MFAQMDKIAGVTTPTPVVADPNTQAMKSRADEIRARGATATKVKEQGARETLDVKSAEESGAFLPADTEATREGRGILEVGKAVANIPSSAINLGKNLIQGAGSVFQIKGEASKLIEEAGGIGNALKFAAPEVAKNLLKLPLDIVTHLAEQYGADELVKGNLTGALDQLHRKIVNDPVGVFADIELARSGVAGVKKLASGGTPAEAVGAARETLPQPKEAVVKTITKTQDKVVNALEGDYSKWAEATKTGVKKVGKAEQRTEALNRAGTTGKTPQRVLAEHKIIPETSGTKFTTGDQAGNFREATRPLVEARNAALEELRFSTEPLVIDDLERQALQNASQRGMTAGETESLLKDVHDEYGALRRKYGDSIDVTDLASENSKYWGKTKFDSTKPFKGTSNYEIGKSMQLAIEDVATKGGYDDIAQLNREIGDRMEAAKFLESLDGQTLSRGKLGKYVFMGIGASLGNTILGKIMGSVAGDMVGQILMDASVSNPVKKLILDSINVKNPEAYKATLDWIKEQEVLRGGRLKLSAPEAIITPEPTPRGTTAADKAANDAYFRRQADINTPKLPPGSTDIRLPNPPGAGTPGPADTSALGQFGQSGDFGITPFRKTVRRKNRSLKEIKGLKGY